MSQRTWWAEQWPEGEQYIAGLVAQDVQDALFESVGRWPVCVSCEGPEHSLYIQPDLGGPTAHRARSDGLRPRGGVKDGMLSPRRTRPEAQRRGKKAQASEPSWTRSVYLSER